MPESKKPSKKLSKMPASSRQISASSPKGDDHDTVVSNKDEHWVTSLGTPFGMMVQITLNAVLAALANGQPLVLCTQHQTYPEGGKGNGKGKKDAKSGSSKTISALPYGIFDPRHHRTFEIGIRDWVSRQTRVALGYVEQLYTFGDRGREILTDDPQEYINHHIISVGYLALAQKPASVDVADAKWRDWYLFFPWEDWRQGEPKMLSTHLLPSLKQWAQSANEQLEKDSRLQRIRIAFGYGEVGWEEERILERYELMYAAGLVAEARYHHNTVTTQTKIIDEARLSGLEMASDHRRILATAIARLRGKLKYRPVIFEMIGEEFTLLNLQKSVEAIIGFPTHKQNFRRSVEGTGLVLRTGKMSSESVGRPAALFKVNRILMKDRAASRLVLPRLNQSPRFKL